MTSPTEAEVADLAKLIEAAFEDDQTVNEAGDKFYEIGIARHILAAGYRLPMKPVEVDGKPTENERLRRLPTEQEIKQKIKTASGLTHYEDDAAISRGARAILTLIKEKQAL